MSKRYPRIAPLCVAIVCATLDHTPLAQAGQEIAAADKKMVVPEERGFPAGSMTIGAQFSENLSTGFLDSMTPFWAPGDAVFSLNTRSSFDDESEVVSSAGLGVRYLLPDPQIILGANVYYDGVHGRDGSDFNQLGFGVEFLSRWVDARVNYYLPEGDRDEVTVSHRRESHQSVSGPFRNGNSIQQTFTDSDRKQTFRTYEAALEGWNSEIGFLVPGLDRYMEVRLFGGYYHYVNPFGSDYEGFKARFEARLLPGVIADAEYWDDATLTGGHWTAGVRVQVPFSFFNLCSGRNPFEGTGEMFKSRQREFPERLSEMVIRSHRVKTVTSGPILTSDRQTNESNTVTIGQVPQAAPPPRRTVGTVGEGSGGTGSSVGGVTMGGTVDGATFTSGGASSTTWSTPGRVEAIDWIGSAGGRTPDSGTLQLGAPSR